MGVRSGYLTKTFFQENHWIPVRAIFEPHVESIDWDNQKKIAYIKNLGKELVINFSGVAVDLKENQVMGPSKHVKFINGKSYIDGFWIGWIFDMYATEIVDPERGALKHDLFFLNIVEIDMPVGSIPKDKTLHLAIFFKKE